MLLNNASITLTAVRNIAMPSLEESSVSMTIDLFKSNMRRRKLLNVIIVIYLLLEVSICNLKNQHEVNKLYFSLSF